MERLKGAIKQLDLFRVPVRVVYNKHQTSSTFGGLVTISCISLSIAMFMPTFLSFLSFDKFISSEVNYHDISTPVVFNNDQIDFAVIMVNLRSKKRVFDITYSEVKFTQNGQGHIQSQYTQKPSVRCDLDDWERRFGKSVKVFLQKYDQESVFCAPKNHNYSVYGNFNINSSRVLIDVTRCGNEDCVTDQEFQELNNFFVLLVFPEMIFNPHTKKFLSYVLRNNLMLYIDTSNNAKEVGYELGMREYDIDDRDTNIWPGGFLTNQSEFYQGFDMSTFQTTEVYGRTFTIVKSPKKIVLVRRITKIDQVISYLGGFLSILIALGGFVVTRYNERLMLMKLGYDIQGMQSQSKQPLYESFNFFQHIRLILGKSCIKKHSDGSFAQKAQYLLESMEGQVSIDRILLRIQNCESFISKSDINISQNETSGKLRNRFDHGTANKVYNIEHSLTGQFLSVCLYAATVATPNKKRTQEWKIIPQEEGSDQIMLYNCGAEVMLQVKGDFLSLIDQNDANAGFIWEIFNKQKDFLVIREISSGRVLKNMFSALTLDTYDPYDRSQEWQLHRI